MISAAVKKRATFTRRGFLKGVMAGVPLLAYRQHPGFPYMGQSEEEKIPFGYGPDAIKLSSNENPLGPSPLALKGMELGIQQGHRYTMVSPLEKKLIAYHKLQPRMLLLGCGSTEILKITPRAFLKDGGELVTALQTFKTIGREAERLGAKVRWVPLREDYRHHLSDMLKAVNENTRVVNIVNPNNPTGTALSYEEIRGFVANLPSQVVVLIDEAYRHFIEKEHPKSGIDLVLEGANVIVTRTFSKAYGLAGMRLGYGVAKAEIIEKLRPHSMGGLGVNQAVYGAAMLCLDDQEHVARYVNLCAEGRDYYYREFDSLGFKHIRSVAPFLMVDVRQDSEQIVKKLAKKKIYIRKGRDWDMPTFLRISMGTMAENRACLSALKEILGQ
ncbi:MAG: aminotransferase class I/II-fold pyridoxal phosphate-dependent enzyme [Candidatus Aminicenantes bacterium]|nr:aminotransferase class I/II-fold pyridoxal phosphate-dependent enzyme [Candidatus Aminicenantes bacterium]